MTDINKDNKPNSELFDGIVTEGVLKAVLEQTNQENQPKTVQIIKKLEPIFFKDILRTANEMKKFGRGLGLSGTSLDRLGDIVATAYIKGFLAHRIAVNKLDSNKLNELYKMDWEEYCDRVIDLGVAKEKDKKNKAIESIEPPKKKLDITDLVGKEDIEEDDEPPTARAHD